MKKSAHFKLRKDYNFFYTIARKINSKIKRTRIGIYQYIDFLDLLIQISDQYIDFYQVKPIKKKSRKIMLFLKNFLGFFIVFSAYSHKKIKTLANAAHNNQSLLVA